MARLRRLAPGAVYDERLMNAAQRPEPADPHRERQLGDRRGVVGERGAI